MTPDDLGALAALQRLLDSPDFQRLTELLADQNERLRLQDLITDMQNNPPDWSDTERMLDDLGRNSLDA